MTNLADEEGKQMEYIKTGLLFVLIFLLISCGGSGGNGQRVMEEEPNNSTTTAQDIAAPITITGSLNMTDINVGDYDDIYSLDTIGGKTYNMVLSGLNRDADMYYVIYDDGGNWVGDSWSERNGTANEELSFTAIAGYSYYVVVVAYDLGVINYTLRVTSN